MMSKHGIAGKSKSAIEYRQVKQRAAPTQVPLALEAPAPELVVPITASQVKPDASGAFKCPQCPEVYARRSALGIHMRVKHGIKGRSYYYTEKRARELVKQGDETNGSSAIEATQRNGSGQTEIEHHSHGAPGTTTTVHISETAIAIGFDRFQELCKAIAIEYDLPPRSYARRLSELIHATSIR
jgi:hypothetical protein